MDNPAFRYDYVRMVPEHQIGLHAHRVWEVSHVIRGRGTRIIGDKTAAIAEGEVVVIPPDVPHVWSFDRSSTDADGCISNISVFFEDRLIDGLSDLLPELKRSVGKLKAMTDALSYIGETRERLVSELYAMRDKTADARLPHMIRLLLIISQTDDSLVVGHNNSLTHAERRMESIRTFCACNFARNISLEEIASFAGMNKSAFCTFIKRQTGKTFTEYINDIRLKRAIERITYSEDSISEVAYSVGFANVSYFNRLFRAAYRCTPKALRGHRKQ